MIRARSAVIITGVVSIMSLGSVDGEEPKKPLAYPQARRDASVVDDYHGTKVPDPYRWLEDPDSPETRAWVEAENKVTFAFLESIPQRAKIKDRLTRLWNYEKFGIPRKEGARTFWTRNTGLQNQAVYYVADGLYAQPRALIDPNTLSSDGTVALAGFSTTQDGSLAAYGIAAAGSDWNEWKIRDVETGKDLDDSLKWIKFSNASWTKDGKGFFYSRFPEPAKGSDLKGANYHQKLTYHKLGTPQTADTIVYERPDHKEWMFGGEATEDGRYLVVTVRKSSAAKNMILYKDFANSNDEVVELVGNFEDEFNFIDNDGPVFFFQTNKAAPRGRVVAIDITKPASKDWVELIPQAPETLESVSLVGNHFIANYLKDATSLVNVFNLKGRFIRNVEFPGPGTTSGFGGKRGDKETFYAFTSYINPPTIYRYDIDSGMSQVFKSPKVDFHPADYVSSQVFFKSKDGTKIPMLISHKKGLKHDGQNPTLLYAYGGFNISLTPTFSPATIAWMERGGVYAVPNLRGGGEYGEDWHQSGTKLKKQNVFDDFIAAAEYLIAEKITSTPKLAIEGRSNGGLLVGAAMTQRPDLFGAALPGVGVMDMLRFHKFTIGWAWVDDYGSSDNAEQFGAIAKYSPLHNLKPGTSYPPTMVTTADHDDRVVPAHSFKFAAALQDAHKGNAPTLIRIETRAGHGAGKPTAKVIEEVADRFAFLAKVLGMD